MKEKMWKNKKKKLNEWKPHEGGQKKKRKRKRKEKKYRIESVYSSLSLFRGHGKIQLIDKRRGDGRRNMSVSLRLDIFLSFSSFSTFFSDGGGGGNVF